MRSLLHGLFSRLQSSPEGDPGDDHLLTAFLAARDEQAFAAIVRRHGPMVHGVCRRVLGNDADADDAFQATFLVLVRKAEAVRPRSMLGNWLHGVALNVARRDRDQRRRQEPGVRRQRSSTDASPPPDARLVAEELTAVLDQELGRLPAAYRAAVVACDLEGQTRKEAAGRLGWSEGTVASRLARGRALLADRLTRRGIIMPAGGIAAVLGVPSASVAGLPPELLRGAASPVVDELAKGAVRAMTASKLKLAAVWGLAVLGVAGAGVGTALARGLRPADFLPVTGQVVKESAVPAAAGTPAAASAPAKQTHYVLTNPAKDITVVSDRDETLVEFFKRQRLMVAGVTFKEAEALLTAKEPTERLFVSTASYNEAGPGSATYGAVVRIAPLSKPVAELLEPFVTAARTESLPRCLVFRPDGTEKDLWHVVGFTTRTTGVAFFRMKEKKAPDDFAPADLVRPDAEKK